LAASTSSQLGFMLLAIGAGSPVAALVHLVAHAAMKAALFLGAGIFQHASDSTTFERLSGTGRAHPLVFGLFTLAGLALAGLPPLAGFWSKGTIEAAAASSPAAAVLLPITVLGSLLSGAYIARMLRLLWRGSAPAGTIPGLSWMVFALAGLAGLTTVFGLLLEPIARLLHVALPENSTLLLVGPLVALAGLAAGWTGLAERAVTPVRTPAAAGFRVADGWITVAVRPALVLAQVAQRFEAALDDTVGRVGSAGLTLGLACRRFDESDLDGLIVALVETARRLGTSARQVQSGFVSRELALAVIGTGALLLLLLVFS
jgi:NADH-quinone oxidoreductase subunit L